MTQIMKRQMLKQRAKTALPLVGLGVFAVALAGCGGASLNNGGASIITPDSGPAIYGVNALALSSGGTTTGETSGMTFALGGTTTGAIVGATAYQTVSGPGPLPAYQANFPNTGTTPASSPGVPLGFAPSGAFYGVAGSTPLNAVPTNYTGNLTFGVYVSPPVQKNTTPNINTSSLILTSPESPSFSLPLTFDPNLGSGILAQAQYKTAPFPLPAFMQTTGFHVFRAAVADTGTPVQSSTTDFSVLTLAPTDSAALVTINYTNARGTVYSVVGATATITNPLPGVAAYKDSTAPTGSAALPLTTSYADAQGVAVLFAAPGTQTVTVSGVNPDPNGKGTVTGTATVTLTAGNASTATVINTTVSAAPATAATIARAKLLVHHKQ